MLFRNFIVLFLLILSESIDMQHLYFLLFLHYMFRLHAARNINVAYRWTHLILINVNLVQQDATIQDIHCINQDGLVLCFIVPGIDHQERYS
jgi:hypothetical protein